MLLKKLKQLRLKLKAFFKLKHCQPLIGSRRNLPSVRANSSSIWNNSSWNKSLTLIMINVDAIRRLRERKCVVFADCNSFISYFGACGSVIRSLPLVIANLNLKPSCCRNWTSNTRPHPTKLQSRNPHFQSASRSVYSSVYHTHALARSQLKRIPLFLAF